MPALVGGGLKVRLGEISLAHLCVLFLDELPEFQRAVLDSLRRVSRVSRTIADLAGSEAVGRIHVARRSATATTPRATEAPLKTC